MTDVRQYGLYPGQGKYHEEIIYTLALVYNLASQRIGEYLKSFGLTLGKLNILIAIKHHGGVRGLRQVELSQHLILTPSNMTKMIDKLEHDGLVTRSAMEGDRRVNIVKATPAARELLDELWPGFQQVLQEQVQGLSKEQQRQLAGLLTGWFQSLVP